jgi:hypothetical protein
VIRKDHALFVQVKEAFRIITEDVKVKAILVNVFGGIVNCATIANGIVNACKSIDLKVSCGSRSGIPGKIRIRDKHPGLFFRLKYLNSLMRIRIRDPESF